MPIGLHLFMMVGTVVVGFFPVAWYALQFRGELVAAGVPGWIVYLSAPILWPLTVICVFRWIPALCPGCGWPVAFLRLGPRCVYRCVACRHVHCTALGRKARDTGPSRDRVRLSRLLLTESLEHRVTFTGQAFRPCTLVLSIGPAPPLRVKGNLATYVEARVTDNRGEVLVHAAGPLKQWSSDRVSYPWRTDLELRHPEWQNRRLPASHGVFALELKIGELDAALRSLKLTIALEFLYGGG